MTRERQLSTDFPHATGVVRPPEISLSLKFDRSHDGKVRSGRRVVVAAYSDTIKNDLLGTYQANSSPWR